MATMAIGIIVGVAGTHLSYWLDIRRAEHRQKKRHP